MIISVFLFALGLVMLIKGGDWFVDGATGIARKLYIPEMLIGATVVSIGTTLPEVMVSATSAATGHGSLAYGNAIGSIICNTCLILAVTIAARPAKAERKSFRTPAVFFLIAAAFYVITAYTTGYFSRITGISLLAIFAVYLLTTFRQIKKGSGESAKVAPAEEGETGTLSKNVILLIIGAALIAVGARFLVTHGTIIARALGVPESVIALTIVAIGTSLPELITAVNALIKGHSSIALGNIIGANLFNLVLVSGISVTIAPYGLPAAKTIAGMNAALVVDTPVMIFSMLFVIIPALVKERLSRVQGIILLAIYAAFCVFQFVF